MFSLDFKTLLLIAEATFYLGWARFMIRFYPFSKIAPSLGLHMKETQTELLNEHKRSLAHVRQVIHIASRNTPWESKCLARALAGMRMLERRHIASTLYLGTTKDEAGVMIAHAWLRSGPVYITGAEEMDRFTVISTFAKVIHDSRGK